MNYLTGIGVLSKKITKQEFLNRAKMAHGDTYSYTHADFVSMTTKIEIHCSKHGPFDQSPMKHVAGQGCPRCKRLAGGRKRAASAGARFVKRARAYHGDRYDYSQVVYSAAKTPVVILCRDHGPFEQTPDNHMRGRGCPVCAGRIPITAESFHARAEAMHGTRYRYILPEKFTAHTMITVICETHGAFEQRLYHHISGVGCGLCAGKVPLTQEIFLERARAVHGEVYDYRHAVYAGYHEHLEIGCREHGIFRTTPASHIHGGTGCPVCASSIYERRVRYWLEDAGIVFEPEWRHHDCRDKRPLPFDFYLPSFNLLIEVDGPQHFKPIFWRGSGKLEEAKRIFREVQRRDRIKTRWAAAQKIPLLRLKYDSALEEILEGCLLAMGWKAEKPCVP